MTQHASQPDAGDVPFASHAVRLSWVEWLVALTVVAAVLAALSWAWQRAEPLAGSRDDRLPYRLSNDYWQFERLANAAGRLERTLVVGDSVVWGHYVAPHETLSGWLNARTGGDGFANLGVDGIHPVALEGLIEHYGGGIGPVALEGLIEHYGIGIDRRNVVLHLNFLWMSSARHDLSSRKEFAFNHPRLVPQFRPAIPCYRATVSERLAIVVGREAPFLAWADHVRTAYFDGRDLASWTLDHPYACPWRQVTFALPSAADPPVPPPDARPWTEKGLPRFSPRWVDLDESLQWAAFRRTAERLATPWRGRVFVVVGPFNEHMLEDEALAAYKRLTRQAQAWLDARGIPYLAPEALPSRLYADASHPLAEGYRRLAETLLADKAFQEFNVPVD